MDSVLACYVMSTACARAGECVLVRARVCLKRGERQTVKPYATYVIKTLKLNEHTHVKKEITPQSATQHTHTLPSTRAHHTHREPLSANPGRHPQRVDPAQVHALAALELLEVPWWVYARVGWMAAVHVIAPCDTHFVQLGESHRTPGLGDGTAPRRRPSGARRQV